MEKGIYNSADGFVIVDFGKKLEMGVSLAKQGNAKAAFVGFCDNCNDCQKVALYFDNTESIDALVECLGYIKSYIQGVAEEDFHDFDKKMRNCILRFNTNCHE